MKCITFLDSLDINMKLFDTEYKIEVYEECMSVWLEHFTIQSSKDDAITKLQQFRELNPQLTYRL